jgi:hypothetical protein
MVDGGSGVVWVVEVEGKVNVGPSAKVELQQALVVAAPATEARVGEQRFQEGKAT